MCGREISKEEERGNCLAPSSFMLQLDGRCISEFLFTGVGLRQQLLVMFVAVSSQ
jgi:hypothetical protein